MHYQNGRVDEDNQIKPELCFCLSQLEIGSLEALCVQYIESSICQENVLVALDSAARLQLDPLKVWQLCLFVVNLKDHGVKSHELQSAPESNKKPVNRLRLEWYDRSWKGREGTGWEWSGLGRNGVGVGLPSSLSQFYPLSSSRFLFAPYSTREPVHGL